ncbi:hypothetical protein ACUOIY_23330, partial [Escherichia coli]
LPNLQQGILISGYDFGNSVSAPCNNTQIGGSANGAGNIISANSNVGIQLNTQVIDTVIQGNYVGVGADGTTALGNNNVGIFVQGIAGATCNGT